jgi:RecA-family ATPase
MNATTPKDAGEFFRNHGANGTRDHVRNNQRPFDPQDTQKNGKRKLPEIVDIMDFLATPLPKPPELIKGILHKRSKLILSGASKSRKTWALAHLAICVAAGQPWWGFDTTPGKVLYANFEIAPEFFQERTMAIKEKLMVEGSKLKGQLKLWNLRGHAADIAQLADQVIDQTKDKYDLIILDPIYKILGDRDENSNGDVAVMMKRVRPHHQRNRCSRGFRSSLQ